MSTNFLNAKDAAERLGISVLTLYDWLAKSNAGAFEIRGEKVAIDYLQGGRRGQGRIRIGEEEIDRILSLMRVRPNRNSPRTKRSSAREFPHITTPLGMPEEQ